ncbi:hypothetical protein FOXB_13704 [Fusarium oxysporum f. sp. conglutinans Fo5176]|uniref:Uncharacterized protein n=1 Tax=Fusarium oxysporum (strain Fo5176) TaxID=660025 RepID=F9G4X2_FUSOF|nr:hypothetical protein FOXB_13704 [Fusarium oxysporum f. sp. conglutinans Fo5176]
MVSIKLFNKK